MEEEEEGDSAKLSLGDLFPPLPRAAQDIGAAECRGSWPGPALSPPLPNDVVGLDTPLLALLLIPLLPRCGEI